MNTEGTQVTVRRTPIVVQDLTDETVFDLVTGGDTSKLSTAQKLAYYKARCDAAGLDYRTTPFQFIKLQGNKEILYSLKAATDALAAKNGIRCEILDQRTEEGIRLVTVRAACKDGRQTDEIGAVSVGGLKGVSLENALMKAVTKAKRRAVLSVTGLGMTDETEIESIPGAVKPTSDLPWAERASAQAALADEGTKDTDLQAALEASLAVAQEDAAPVSAVADANLPRSEDVVSSDGAAPSPSDDLIAEAGRLYDLPEENEPVLINYKDRRYFHVCREQGHHPKDSVKEWLQNTYGISSTSEIHRDWLTDICARLRDPMPL